MFAELMPLVKQRALMITISDIGEGLLRVKIFPASWMALPKRMQP